MDKPLFFPKQSSEPTATLCQLIMVVRIMPFARGDVFVGIEASVLISPKPPQGLAR